MTVTTMLCQLLEARFLTATQSGTRGGGREGSFVPLLSRVERLRVVVKRLRQVKAHYSRVQGGYQQAADTLTELSLRSIDAHAHHTTAAAVAAEKLSQIRSHIQEMNNSIAAEASLQTEASHELRRAVAALSIQEALYDEQQERNEVCIRKHAQRLDVLSTKTQLFEALLEEYAASVFSAELLLDYCSSVISLYEYLHKLSEELVNSEYAGNYSLLLSIQHALLQYHCLSSVDEQPRVRAFLRLHAQTKQERRARVQQALRMTAALFSSSAFLAINVTTEACRLLSLLNGSRTLLPEPSATAAPSKEKRRAWKQEIATCDAVGPMPSSQFGDSSETLEDWLLNYDSSGWRAPSHEKSFSEAENSSHARLRTHRKRKRAAASEKNEKTEPIFSINVLAEESPAIRVRLYSDHETLLQNAEARFGRQLREHMQRLRSDLVKSNLRTNCTMSTESGRRVPVEVKLSSDSGMTVITPNIFEQQQIERELRESRNALVG